MFGIAQNIKDLLLDLNIPEKPAIMIKTVILSLLILLICYIVNLITKRIIITIVTRYVRKSETEWDDIFLDEGVFNRLSHLLPALIIYYFAPHVLNEMPFLIKPFNSAVYIYIISVCLMVANSSINAFHSIYHLLPLSKDRSIKGYVQVVKIILFFIGGILILSVILGQSPYALLAGLGALAAVLLLVFKDTLLGLTASIQLSANKMVKLGDAVSIPSKNIDGIVKEINLSTIKIQNHDKTFSFIPAYSFVSDTFNNWSGVEEEGSRRIRRSINIDFASIKFIDSSWLKAKAIFFSKENIINEEFTDNNTTNLTLFRKYISIYLNNHSAVNKTLPIVVRQLQSDSHGLPIEIYVFITELEMNSFEQIQSEIFEHIIAITPQFDLKVFQVNNILLSR